MNLNKTIVMTGFMGSGKSVIGKHLAARLNVPFRDLDKEIEIGEQESIPAIFKKSGEPGFRELERQYLEHYIAASPHILALGGGALQQGDMIAMIHSNGVLVYLDVPLDVLFNRLKNDKKRPLLRDDNGKLLADPALKARISKLLTSRKLSYRKADITVSVDPEWDVTKTTNEVLRELKQHAPFAIAESH